MTRYAVEPAYTARQSDASSRLMTPSRAITRHKNVTNARTGYSSRIVLPVMAIGRISERNPRMTVMLKMLDPTTLATAMSAFPCQAAIPLTREFRDARARRDDGQADDRRRQAQHP